MFLFTRILAKTGSSDQPADHKHHNKVDKMEEQEKREKIAEIRKRRQKLIEKVLKGFNVLRVLDTIPNNNWIKHISIYLW